MGREKRSSKHDIEATLISIVGVIIVISTTVRHSSAQSNCWQKVTDCLNDKKNESTSNPDLNPASPSFNNSEFFCCPLLQQLFLNEKTCFCTIIPALQADPNSGTLKVFTYCNLTRSLPSLESFCGLTSPPPPLPASRGSDKVLPLPVARDSPPPAPPTGKKKVILIVAAVSAIVLVLVALGIALYTIKFRKKPNVANSDFEYESRPTKATGSSPPPGFAAVTERDDDLTPESLHYEFTALKEATNNFSDDHVIGRGGFGIVYKGTLSNGQEVAVKRLSRGSWQGDKEFKNEAGLVAKLQHRNLVRLVGFCLPEEERLLVYEFMPNKSLDQILFDPDKQKQLNWSKRYNIVKGIARGMLYLHEDSPTRIIHRDLKAANVLLDADMNPKIADFGMAKICDFEQTRGDTSRVIGTYGYMAPEYLLHGHFSLQSDVYSFGVLVLEIVGGTRVASSMHEFGSNRENLLSFAWKCLKDGKPLDLMDPTLRDSYVRNEIIRCIYIGLLCVQEGMRKRPTMEKVVLMFNSEFDVGSLILPEHPGIMQGRYAEDLTSSNISSMPWSTSEGDTKPVAR